MTGVSDREPALTKGLIKPEQSEYKGSLVLILGFFSLTVCPGSPSSLILHPRGGLGGKVGSACDEFEDNEEDISS